MKHSPPRYSVRNILIDNNNWGIYKINHPELNKYIIDEIEKMLDCCNPEKGFFYGYCEHCKKEVVMHIKCNGKVCSRCGKQYIDKWVEKAGKKIFKEMHRMVTLTVPADIRNMLKGRWDLMKILQDSSYEAIEFTVSKALKKKIKLGILVGLQTFGQDVKLHPHMHCMVLEKAKYNGKFVDFKYIPAEHLRKTWRNVLIENLCKADISYEEKELLHSMKDKYPNGFVVDVKKKNMNQKEIIRYLARYIRHPPIADSRIIFYGRGKVIIRMKDKEKRPYSTWFTVDEFITRLIMHIPDKNFKIVRWYGLYSRREVRIEREKSKIRVIQETIFFVPKKKKRKFKCPKCKNQLKDVFWIINKPPDKKKLMNKLNYWVS